MNNKKTVDEYKRTRESERCVVLGLKLHVGKCCSGALFKQSGCSCKRPKKTIDKKPSLISRLVSVDIKHRERKKEEEEINKKNTLSQICRITYKDIKTQESIDIKKERSRNVYGL